MYALALPLVTLGMAAQRMPCQGRHGPLAIRAVFLSSEASTMPTHNLLLLAGDGIGPEVMAEVKRLIAWMNAHGMGTFESEEGLVGGSAYDAHGVAITDETMAKAHACDAVIFGAVGGPEWDQGPYDVRPEAGVLRLAKELGPFGHHSPAACLPAPPGASAPHGAGGDRLG